MSLDTFALVVRFVGLGGVAMFMSSVLFLKDNAPPMIEWTWRQWLMPCNNTHWYRSPGDRLLVWGLVVGLVSLPIQIAMYLLACF